MNKTMILGKPIVSFVQVNDIDIVTIFYYWANLCFEYRKMSIKEERFCKKMCCCKASYFNEIYVMSFLECIINEIYVKFVD